MGYIVDLETNTINKVDAKHIDNNKNMKPNTYDRIKYIVSEQNNEYNDMKNQSQI